MQEHESIRNVKKNIVLKKNSWAKIFSKKKKEKKNAMEDINSRIDWIQHTLKLWNTQSEENTEKGMKMNQENLYNIWISIKY